MHGKNRVVNLPTMASSKFLDNRAGSRFHSCSTRLHCMDSPPNTDMGSSVNIGRDNRYGRNRLGASIDKERIRELRPTIPRVSSSMRPEVLQQAILARNSISHLTY